MQSLALAIEVVAQVSPVELPDAEPVVHRLGLLVAGVVVVLLVGRLLLVPAVSRLVLARNPNNPTLEEAVSRYVRLLVLIVALVVGLATAGFTGVLGNSAIVFAAATLALGVAGQEVIGSLVSGLALVVDPQFNVGNYIRWSDGEGEVRSITLRVTRVQTPDGGLVTIPNTRLTDEAVQRPFESGRARVLQRVQIAYEDDVETAVSALTEAAAGTESVLGEPAPTAGVHELAADGVVLELAYWVDDPRSDQVAVQRAVTRRTRERLRAAGVTINPATKRDLTGAVEVDRPA